MVLDDSKLVAYAERFNAFDEEIVSTSIGNDRAGEWMASQIPRLDCPDREIEEIYHFRWWTYRKHLRQTAQGLVVTEFLPPVPWAGKHNAIACAAGHHLYEGRWMRDAKRLFEYVEFWYCGGGALHVYSDWIPDGLYRLCCATGQWDRAISLLPDLVADAGQWEREQRHQSGLFWSNDGRDGGEFSISGSGLRTTLNSYTVANMRAIAAFAGMGGQTALCEEYTAKAESLKQLMLRHLWDEKAGFFRCIPLNGRDTPVPDWSFDRMDPYRVVRELWGYLPWYFGIPGREYDRAWQALVDGGSFEGAYGLTTAEREHPQFGLFYTGKELAAWQQRHVEESYGPVGEQGHECLWNGPSWPFATSQLLTALANHIEAAGDDCMLRSVYMQLLGRYAHAQHRVRDDGVTVPWIDENLHPDTGDWISRTRLKTWTKGSWDTEKGGRERGKDYNHSTYCDLIISGLFGIRPKVAGFDVAPLLPDDWNWACLDGVPVQGHRVTVLWDRTGERYSRGAGFRVLVDGVERAAAQKPSKVCISV